MTNDRAAGRRATGQSAVEDDAASGQQPSSRAARSGGAALRWVIGGVVTLVALTALIIGAFGVVVSRVPEYRVQVQNFLNERSGLVVEFKGIRARLALYGPELIFDEAVVRTPDRTRVLATATRGSVGFDLWRAVREGRLAAGRFTLQAPQIGLIRTRDGRIQLLGQSALPERPDAKPFAIEQLPTGAFDVEDAVVTFRDEITGRGPWSVSGVDFELTRTEEELRLRGDASLPESLGRELSFTATAEGRLEEQATLVSTFSLEGEGVDLAGWADVLPDRWPAPETGSGSIRVSGALLGPKLTQLSADVHFKNVAAVPPAWSTPLPQALPMEQPQGDDEAPAESFDTPEGATASVPEKAEDPSALPPEVVSFDRVALSLRAQRVDDEWTTLVQNVQLDRKESKWRAKELRARWRRDAEGRFASASGSADRIALDSLWPLLAFLPESERAAHARALHARGVIEAVSASFERGEDGALTYEAKARFRDVGFEPVSKAPGFSGLSGEIDATQAGGRWRVGDDEIRFALPRWYRDVLTARVQGEIEWRPAPEGWVVSGDGLRVRNDDGRATADLRVTLAPGASPVLKMSAQGEDLRVASASRYIPAGRLGARTVEWFDQAFVGGRVSQARFHYDGPTRAFPFRKGEGEFRVEGHVEEATFSYQPGWKHATNVVADVEFRNEGMRVRATQADIGPLHVTAASANIKDLKDPTLTIRAAARGDVGGALHYLKDSPLGPKLGETFAKLQGAGDLTTDVRLHLPIKQMANRDIEVIARVANATASLDGVDAPIRELEGALTVRNTLVAAADLSGEWLGGRVRVAITPDGRSAATLIAEGEASAAPLRTALKTPPSIELQGAADWRLTARMAVATEGESPVRLVKLESDTQGLAIGLPAPLGKSQSEARPLQVSLEMQGRESAAVRGSFGDVRALVRLHAGENGWSMERGGLRADGGAPALPDHQGLRIEGEIERFVLDEWLALRSPGHGEGKPLSTYLHAANVRVHDFQAFGYQWPDVRGLAQATEAGWRIDVSGAKAQGQILLPLELVGEQPIRATLEHLVLERAPVRSERVDERVDPRKLPAVQAYIGDLRVGVRTIGALDLRATRTPQGLRFDRASVLSDALRGEVRGHWFVTASGQEGRLDGSVSSENVAAALRALNYSPFIEAKRGEVRADLTWPGGFNGNFLAKASGAISVAADSGQLVNVQPGAGRVLGLFSLAALPRRLSLDFSDLTEKGLAFDTIRGDFELRDGHAHTNNLLLSGPAAEIGIAGRTGLASRDYDQTAVVTGKLGASLPVAGALAGGPAVGAALLLFSQVFKEPLKGITRGYYRITGPWDNPRVERVDESQAKAEVAGD